MAKWLLLFCLAVTLPLHAGVRTDMRKGGKLYKQKKYGQALTVYKQALQHDPQQQDAALGAGASAYYLKDYTAAQQAFTQAAKQPGPRQEDALFNLGNAYYRAQQNDQAKQAYRQAILQNPNDKEAIHNLQLLLQAQQNQSKQNNQNKQNKDKDSNNQQPNQQQNPAGDKQEPSSRQNPADPQPDKEAAQRVMQMAQENEFKPRTQTGNGTVESTLEKDW